MNPQLPADEFTGEAIAAMIIVPILILLFAAAAVLCFRRLRAMDRDEMDRPLWLTGGIVASVATIATAALLWWGMYPWKAEYHEWRAVTGTVATVDSRLVSAGEGSMQDKYVVTFDGNEQQYGVLDTRAAGVKPGDTLTITCVRRWQWSGTHGYDCNFIDLVRRTR